MIIIIRMNIINMINIIVRMLIDQIVGDLGISHCLSPLALARSLANPNPDSKVPVVCQQWTLQWSTMVTMQMTMVNNGHKTMVLTLVIRARWDSHGKLKSLDWSSTSLWDTILVLHVSTSVGDDGFDNYMKHLWGRSRHWWGLPETTNPSSVCISVRIYWISSTAPD